MEFLAWITSGGGNAANRWEYSVGHTRDEDFWKALAKVPSHAWTPALDHKGQPRKDAGLAEITDMPDLDGRPSGMRVIVRREPIHPKYERELKPYEKKTDFRYQAIATNTPGEQLQFLDARARSHTHVEAGIRRGKALSLNLMPSKYFAVNQAWCTLLALAVDLARRLQLLATTGKLARAEPATLRTQLLDVPAKLTDHARRHELKLDPAWPASARVVTAWDAVQALPAPGRPAPQPSPNPGRRHPESPSARGSRRPPETTPGQTVTTTRRTNRDESRTPAGHLRTARARE